MSIVVTRRTREISIRIALGATGGSAIRLVLRDESELCIGPVLPQAYELDRKMCLTLVSMGKAMKMTRLVAISIAIAAIWLFFGYAISQAGYRVLREWSSIGAAYATVGTLWLITGPAMFGAGLWLLGTLGRHRIAFWLGAAAGMLAGASLVVGVLTYVVPCSGPS